MNQASPSTHADNQQADNVAAPRRPIITTCKNLIRVALYLPIVVLVALALVIGTPFGSRVGVMLANQFVPDLELDYRSGMLNKRLSLNYAAWQMDGVKVEVDDLMIEWRPVCLLQKQLCVNALHTSKVNVEVDTAAFSDDDNNLDTNTETADIPPNLTTVATSPQPDNEVEPDERLSVEDETEITLPFGIVLLDGDLSGVTVRVNDMHFNADNLTLAAQWQQTGIRVNNITSNGLYVDIPLGDPVIDDAAPKTTAVTSDKISTDSVNTTGNKTASQPSTIQKNNDSEVDWAMANLPTVFMPIQVFVEQSTLTQSLLKLGQRQDQFMHIELVGSYHRYLINVNKLDVIHDYGKAQLNGQLALQQDYPMQVNLSSQLRQVTEVPGLQNQDIDIKLNGGFNKLTVDIDAKQQLEFTLSGDISLAKPSLDYQLNLNAQSLFWPLQQPIYIANNSKLISQGSLKQQQVDLTGHFDTPYHTPIDIITQFVHQSEQHNIDVSQLVINGEIGNLDAQGKVSYGDNWQWQTQFSSQSFDLSQLTFDADNLLPQSAITGDISSRGSVAGDNWQVAIEQSNLSGHIDDYPFTLSGDISVNQSWHLNANNLNIDALQSKLQISGNVEEDWTLNAHLDVPDISLWHPDAGGAISADIFVSGDNEKPDIAVTADVIEVNFNDLYTEKSKLKGFYSPFDEHRYALSLKSSLIKQAGLTLSSVTFGSKGDQFKQKATLQSFGDFKLDLSVKSTSDLDKQTIDAQILRLNLDSRLGPWQLDNPIALSWDNLQQQGQVTPFCWIHQHAELCVTDNTELAKLGDTQLSLDADIGALLAPIMPETLNWHGPASAQAKFAWSPEQKPQGELTLTLSPGEIILRNQNGRNIDINYKALDLAMLLDEQTLASKFTFESADIAAIDSQLSISVDPERRLDGYLNITEVNLDALSELAPQLETLRGHISSELSIGGNLNDPDVEGSISLKHGQFMATANPTLIEDINVELMLDQQQALVAGTWKMGGGTANLSGDLDWRNKGVKGDIKIKGEKLAIIQPPLALIDLSPDLHLVFDNDSLDIKGEVSIPSGDITIVQLPEGGVAESSDVVFNDSIAQQQLAQSPYAISTDVKVNVGDQLNIQGMGLRGKLVGTLDFRQEPARPPLIYGDIKVVNGNYKFMGQTLEISAGEVQFIGPMELPNLNIEALREVKDEDVVAGVRITGTPRQPIVTLFSTPAKEQAEILSYILKGTGMGNNSEGQNNALMMSVALTLGNQFGNGAVNNVGSNATGVIEKIGFSNVQLDANDDGKVAISGYIGENLMVKYGIGVFNTGYEMTVRYYLLSQLYLETVSGNVEQTLDVYYNFDID
ncbi:translocation/assembly module TamB domain-containing protein [Shewanella waksmanii]|uniref:translocation/assembly module TamB domain-containing protein n=1 Tax=Shewanella waksmanii TaxID=213783 RepID=UPI000490A3D1|nr:translocation/assembly module TamB domain-containing protein [Shewanella waksmanii]